MNEKNFMKQVSESNMPDILEVKKSCIEQLNEDGKERYAHARFPKIAVIAVIVICLCISPVNSLAKNIVQHIKTMLNLKNESVELGNVDETNIQIPDDCEEVRSDGVTYLSKVCNALSDLTKDIQTDINAWIGVDDLLYRTTDEPSVSLEQGEKINISVINGEEYEDVCICLVGKDVIQKVGSLNANTPFSYNVSNTGEYIIYEGENQTNITNEVVIEHSNNAADGLYPLK